MTVVQDTIAAAELQISESWQYATNSSVSQANAFREACRLLIVLRAESMSKGGATSEDFRFSHPAVQQMLKDVDRWITAKSIAGSQWAQATSRCWKGA